MPARGRQKQGFDQDMPWMPSGTPQDSLAWAQQAYDQWRNEGGQGPVPFNTNTFEVGDNGNVKFTEAFTPDITWKKATPALIAAGGVGLGALLGAGGAAAAGGGSAASSAVPSSVLPAGASGGLATTPGVVAGIPAGAKVGATVGSMAGPFGAAPLSPLARGAGSIMKPLVGSSSGGAKGMFGDFLSNLLKPETLMDLGRGVSAIGQTQAANRGTELDAMMEADKMRILQERERSQDEDDLWRRLQAADYMKRGGAGERKPMISASGRQIPMFDFGPAPISEGNKQMATEMEQQLLKRLRNPPQLRDYDSKMKAGLGERTSNWLGPALWMGSKFFGGE